MLFFETVGMPKEAAAVVLHGGALRAALLDASG